MKEPFEQIRITDLDVDLTQPSQEGAGFQRLYLKLSAEPPAEWVTLFEQERRFPRHSKWRNAWVVGTHIVIECVPEDLEQFGLNHLKEDAANANNKFVEWIARNDADNLRQFQQEEEARKQLQELRGKLKFD
ncbi:MAG TPA: hypothetical protein VJA21_11290 [Verrucomicrobiae bacterium]